MKWEGFVSGGAGRGVCGGCGEIAPRRAIKGNQWRDRTSTSKGGMSRCPFM